MEERVRASFQDRGYFKVEVKSLSFKPCDPLGVPKPVALEGEISEGAPYKLAKITFVENHAFFSGQLRQQFALKSGDLFKRGKVASGLQSLRKLYGTQGFLDFTAIPRDKLRIKRNSKSKYLDSGGTRVPHGKTQHCGG